MSYPSYSIEARWGGGVLAPEQVGAGLLETIRRLGPLAPAKVHWTLLVGSRFKSFPLAGADPAAVTDAVKRNISRTDFGKPDPDDGYVLVVIGSDNPGSKLSPDDVHLSMQVGSQSTNFVRFRIGDIRNPVNFDLVTYPIYKAALQIIAQTWPCPWVFANTFDPDRQRGGRPYETAWMAYLSAPLVERLTPPPQLVVEPTPGGGMLISAVERVIDRRNGQDMRRSRMLTKIMKARVGPGGMPATYPLTPARQGPY